MSLSDRFEDDSAMPALPSKEVLSRLSELSRLQLRLEQEIMTAEENLKLLQGRLDQVRDRDLPDLLMSNGLTELCLTSGEKVQVSRIVSASIKKENASQCFAWLDKNGFGDIVKRRVEVDIGKDGKEESEKILAFAEELGLNAEDKKSVHPMTLKAFVNEQMEKAADLPLDLFGVYIINRSKIKA